MLKLMKYEFLKQKTSKLVLGGILLVAELTFLAGLLLTRENMMATGIMFLIFTSIGGFVVTGLEAIVTFYHDMKEKQGYLLFMTPHSVYEIIGSKMVGGIITIAAWTILILVLAFLDVTILSAKYTDIMSAVEMAQMMFADFFAMEISWSTVILAILNLVFEWIAMILSAFLAIALTLTYLARFKAKGIIAFVIFNIMNLISGKLTSLLQKAAGTGGAYTVEKVFEANSATVSVSNPNFSGTGIAFLVAVVFGVVCFLGTAQLLQKKLSL